MKLGLYKRQCHTPSIPRAGVASTVFPLFAHADFFHVSGPIWHAGGAISRNDRAIWEHRHVYGLDRQ